MCVCVCVYSPRFGINFDFECKWSQTVYKHEMAERHAHPKMVARKKRRCVLLFAAARFNVAKQIATFYCKLPLPSISLSIMLSADDDYFMEARLCVRGERQTSS